MTRSLTMVVATTIYLLFFATFLYLVGFVAGLPLLPASVDHGPVASPGRAAVIDIALIALFGLQHSVMARPGFKAAWRRVVPEPLERSVYVLAASLVLILLFACWYPIGGIVWRVTTPIGRDLLWALFGAGWVIVLLSTFMISHFELFGLTQAFNHWRQRQPAAAGFRIPLLYRIVRHPLYAGFFIAFWSTPTMSYGHLLLAIGMSAYMLLAIPLEERDLIGIFGDDYHAYRGRVGMLVPRLRRRVAR